MDKSVSVLKYYHTALRNMGLYTSIALAALVYSRFHRGKNFTLNVIMIVISLIFTLLSVTIGLFLLQDIEMISNNDKTILPMIEKWLLLPNIVIYTNSAVILSTLYVLFVQFS
jgi:hypothetical protein